jgi:hypothetical protein
VHSSVAEMQSNRKRDRFIIKSDTKCDSDISISLLTCRHLDRFLHFRWKESLKAVGRWTSRKKHLSNRKHFKSGNKPVEFVPVSAQNPTHFLLPPRTKAEPFLLEDNVKSSADSFRGKMRRISSQTKGPSAEAKEEKQQPKCWLGPKIRGQ